MNKLNVVIASLGIAALIPFTAAYAEPHHEGPQHHVEQVDRDHHPGKADHRFHAEHRPVVHHGPEFHHEHPVVVEHHHVYDDYSSNSGSVASIVGQTANLSFSINI
ncbi:MAG TPA: hypothetical protein DCR21_01210 [Succinivibrionaceae bacterium]|nr:hypothetical protein [Succinivibrionaceae bacterium]